LDEQELLHSFAIRGAIVAQEQITELLNAFDQDKDGKLSETEYKQFILTEYNNSVAIENKIMQTKKILSSADPVAIFEALTPEYRKLLEELFLQYHDKKNKKLNKLNLQLLMEFLTGIVGFVPNTDQIKLVASKIKTVAKYKWPDFIVAVTEACMNPDILLLMKKVTCWEDLSELEQNQLRMAFIASDEDGNGVIDAKEFKKALRLIVNKPLSESEVQSVMDRIDVNHDGVVEWSEYVNFFIASINETIDKLQAEIRAAS